MTPEITSSGVSEAVILIKAAPQVSQKHGETVCCAAIDIYGRWLRLYPVSFRHLEDVQKFGRWDRVRFRWRKPKDDARVESRRVDQDTLTTEGELKPAERERFLARAIVTSLDKERVEGKSLALLRAEILGFHVERKPDDDFLSQKKKFDELRSRPDLFNTKPLIPYCPAPYQFKYAYRTDDGKREGTCQDWEIEAAFYNWSREYGEKKALEFMRKKFGEDLPQKGMLLAMGTHSRRHDQWLINGVVRLDNVTQMSLL